MKKFFSTALSVLLLFAFAFPASAGLGLLKEERSQTEFNNSLHFSTAAGYTSGGTSLPELIGEIIQVFLGLLGVVFLGLIIYAGFRWMTAQGGEDDVKQAKQTIERAVIGLAIVLAAYAISYFVVAALQSRTLST